MSWTFRTLTRTDFPLLATWLADTDVHRWWQHDPSTDAVERDFGPTVDGLEPGEDLVAELDGRPVGLVQRARACSYPEDRAVFERIAAPVHPRLGGGRTGQPHRRAFAPRVPPRRPMNRSGGMVRRGTMGYMLITVTGASGRTGNHVVTALLAAGHSVRAVVRSEPKGAPLRAQGAEIALADLTTDDPAMWLAGADALIHTAASSDPTPGASDAVDRDATLRLVAGAEQAGVRRMIQVSSMYADRPQEGPEFLRDVLRSKAVSDAALAESGLTWTIVRPGGLLDDPATDLVAAGRLLDSGRISRADVATVCVACLAQPTTERLAFDLTSGGLSVADALAGLGG